MKTKTPLGIINDPSKNQWTLKINGEIIEGVKFLELYNPNFGEITYGKHPRGYDCWFFHENGGGGEITILYFKDSDGLLYISLLKENRVNMGGENYCAIGGFFDPTDANKHSAVHRETEEETGLTFQLEELPGLLVNTNRAVFITNAKENDGLICYCAEISTQEVEKDPLDNNLYKFKSHLENPKSANIKFVPWNLLQEYTSDGFMYILGYKLLVKLNRD